MPLYEFYCHRCSDTFERILRSDFQVTPECPKCGDGSTEKVINFGGSFEITGDGVYKPGKHY